MSRFDSWPHNTDNNKIYVFATHVCEYINNILYIHIYAHIFKIPLKL